MRKILILSVPHTGTNFTKAYMEEVLMLPWTKITKITTEERLAYTYAHTFLRIAPQQRTIHKNIDRTMTYVEEHCNVIIPIRDPIDSVISCYRRGREDLDYPVGTWKTMLECYPRIKNIFWLDVWTPKENRRNMMLKLNEFLDIEPEQELFDDFVTKWHPRNASDDVSIDLEKHDFSRLQFAVDWYNEKKKELNKFYRQERLSLYGEESRDCTTHPSR